MFISSAPNSKMTMIKKRKNKGDDLPQSIYKVPKGVIKLDACDTWVYRDACMQSIEDKGKRGVEGGETRYSFIYVRAAMMMGVQYITA